MRFGGSATPCATCDQRVGKPVSRWKTAAGRVSRVWKSRRRFDNRGWLVGRDRNATVGAFLASGRAATLIPPGSAATVRTRSWQLRSVELNMPGRALSLCFALATLVAALPGGNADAANWLEMNFYLSGPRYDGVLPPCDHPAALEKIAKRFSQKEGTFWASDLTIVRPRFARGRRRAFRAASAAGASRSPTAVGTPSTIRSRRTPA